MANGIKTGDLVHTFLKKQISLGVQKSMMKAVMITLQNVQVVA